MESQPQNPEFRNNPENSPMCLPLINSFSASGICGKLLQNSLDPDQARQYVRPDLNPNCFPERFFEDSKTCPK